MILFLFFTSCGFTLGERFDMQKYKRIGRSNAINYIEEKYGFTPTVKDVSNTFPELSVPDFWPTPEEDVIVSMEYEGKEFTVEITGEEKSLDGADDYQKDEIIESLTTYLIKHYPSVEEVVFPDFEENWSLFGPKFEGENYNELVTNNIYSDVILKICEPDVNDFPIEKLKSELDFDSISIINYNNNKKMPSPNTNIYLSGSGYGIDEIMPYISQYLWYYNPNKEGSEPQLTTVYTTYYDSLVICSASDEPVIIEPNTDSPTYDMDAANETLISSYRIKSNQDNFIICVPIQDMDKGTALAVTDSKGYSYLREDNADYISINSYMVSNHEDDTSDYDYSSLIYIVSKAEEE